MKAITLTQPWATLVAIGAKRIETRSWATNYRGRLAIHAAKGLGPVGGKTGLYEIRREQPFWSVLEAAGYLPFDDFPLGAIVATCTLVECASTSFPPAIKRFMVPGKGTWELTDQERAFGDYTPGRYAWLLADVEMLPEPIPATGALGLWEWEQEAQPCNS